MTALEKEILFIISRLRCLTEVQLNKLFNFKRETKKKTLKRTLRRMCSDCILVKFPVNINYKGFRDNSYVYYINGSEFYRGEELVRALISSEVAVKLKMARFEIVRFYKNINIGNKRYTYIEYINPYSNKRAQTLFDVQLKEAPNLLDYEDIKKDIKNSSIPFFMIPNVIVITKLNENPLQNILSEKNISIVDISLASIFRYL